jgi:CheY-like chemotaxis protein
VLDFAASLAGNLLRHRARLRRDFQRCPAVCADEARLGQVFVNLLVNAAEALPAGHADQNEVCVRTATDSRGWAMVEITDTGSGIAPEIRTRIFDPFFTTKPIGVGTGLGLSICHEIVSSMGGEIEVESQPDRGSLFRVLLPQDDSVPFVAPSRPMGKTPARLEVLVVDDQKEICRSLVALLAREHRVSFELSGAQALGRITAGERFDVIVCDLMMPNMTGMTLQSAIDAVAPAQARRMVFMTGGAFTPEGQAFVQATSNPVIEKPFQPEQLKSAFALVSCLPSAQLGA